MDTFVLKGEVTAGLTDDEFLRFCLDNPDLRIERNSKLEIIIMSPTGSLSGKINTEILRQLSNWNYQHSKGEVFDSSSGFLLPDKSVLSPDVSWISSKKWKSLTLEQQISFAPVCPEFVIEVRSKADNLEELKKKMMVWLKNGAEVAWLIDPSNDVTWIFRQAKPVEEIKGFDKKITGEGPVSGFVLDLSLIKI
jgi:Uma2 family endonuclease